jgi:hypothetical protein
MKSLLSQSSLLGKEMRKWSLLGRLAVWLVLLIQAMKHNMTLLLNVLTKTKTAL